MAVPNASGRQAQIQATHMKTYSLDSTGMRLALAGAPAEFTAAGRTSSTVISLPSPTGKYARFRITQSQIMMPALAKRHPEIRTYSGRGIDDPTATIAIAMTPLGFNASVRGATGPWFIDPLYHLDQSVYAQLLRART